MDLSNAGFLSAGALPIGAGNRDSYGAISTRDWAFQPAPAARGLNPFADPPSALRPGMIAGGAALAAAAGGAAAAHRNGHDTHSDLSAGPDAAPSMASTPGSSHSNSLPSPVSRVLEAHGHDPRPLHPLEREMELQRQASISAMGSSEGDAQEERSPLMEYAMGSPPRGMRGGGGHEELWMGTDGYQRVVTDDV